MMVPEHVHLNQVHHHKSLVHITDVLIFTYRSYIKPNLATISDISTFNKIFFLISTVGQVETITSVTSTTPSTQENPSPGDIPQISTAPGSHMFKANNYHAKLMHLAQKLSEVAKVTVCMEVNGACI